jgi:hypothetical protein
MVRVDHPEQTGDHRELRLGAMLRRPDQCDGLIAAADWVLSEAVDGDSCRFFSVSEKLCCDGPV